MLEAHIANDERMFALIDHNAETRRVEQADRHRENIGRLERIEAQIGDRLGRIEGQAETRLKTIEGKMWWILGSGWAIAAGVIAFVAEHLVGKMHL